jgi:CRP/FNR family transcriptional regulator, cyclic AMP receptor protein
MTLPAWHEMVGCAAALLWLLTFFMRQMVALRSVALAASATWLTYGLADHIFPVIAVHSVLLPLNGFRLAQTLFIRPASAARGTAAAAAALPAE